MNNILKWGGVIIANLLTRKYKIGFSIVFS